MTEVILYTRRGCHLCDQARDAILALCDEGLDIALREVDIERDDRLHAELGERIPVVEVAGEIVSELVLDVRSLRSRLDTVAA